MRGGWFQQGPERITGQRSQLEELIRTLMLLWVLAVLALAIWAALA